MANDLNTAMERAVPYGRLLSMLRWARKDLDDVRLWRYELDGRRHAETHQEHADRLSTNIQENEDRRQFLNEIDAVLATIDATPTAPPDRDAMGRLIGEASGGEGAIAAREQEAPLTKQQVYDRFSFLEGLVSEDAYRKIADTAFDIQRERQLSACNFCLAQAAEARAALASREEPPAVDAREQEAKCPDCRGNGVDGDVDDYGRTIDVQCGRCGGSGKARDAGLPWPWKTEQEVLRDAVTYLQHQPRLAEAIRILASRQEAPAPQQSAIPLEASIAWQAGAFDTERKAVTVEGRSWYRDDHPKLSAPSPLAETGEPIAWLHYAAKKPSLRRVDFKPKPSAIEKASGWKSIALAAAQPADGKGGDPCPN